MEDYKNIIIKEFNFLIKYGYRITTNKIYTTDEKYNSNLEIKTDDFIIEYQSLKRIVNIHSFSWANNLEKKPIDLMATGTSIRIKSKESQRDSNFNLNQYIYAKELTTESKKYDLYHPELLSIEDYTNLILLFSKYIKRKLLPLIDGTKWISASMTRVDGFRIIENGKTEYFDL